MTTFVHEDLMILVTCNKMDDESTYLHTFVSIFLAAFDLLFDVSAGFITFY